MTPTPDTRTALYPRAHQISMVADVLATPPIDRDCDEPDYERQMADEEMAWSVTYNCTYPDVIARALAAAARTNHWSLPHMELGAKEREALNARRAANARRYGTR